MISVADQKRMEYDRVLRSYAQLRGYEPRHKTLLRWLGAAACLLLETAILYAAAKVLFFHNLPVW
jgi:type II secretory pathway component PulM